LKLDTGRERMSTLPPVRAMQGLIVFFIYKADKTALILSARDMDNKERRRHGRK
jgi:uncharacterized DUF497 family protein